MSRAKMLGGIGSILTLLLLVPYFAGAALVIIGWILIIWAVKDISDTVQDKSIFNNALISAVMAIIGAVVFAAVVAATILGFIGLGGLSSTGTPPAASDLAGLFAAAALGLFIVWILAIIGSIFLRRSFKTIGTRLNVGLFGTAALVYLIGSILLIIGFGIFLIFIAQILFVVAFFSIPDNPPAGPMPQPQPMRPA